MLGNPKNVFWEAFLLAVVVFAFGLLLGVAFEESRFEDISDYYANSEIFLTDVLALNNLLEIGGVDCNLLISSNLEFADRIYLEAKLLEKYEKSGKLTNSMKLAHKKYDLLRTFLWINTLKTSEQCSENFNTVVYLYEYETEDLTQKATQTVWSKILFELKQQEGDRIILIPIAVDGDLTTLNSLIKRYEISRFPVVIINEELVVDLQSVDQLNAHLN